MPGLIGTQARIAVIVDVSGSVGPKWCARAASYIESLQEDYPSVSCWLASHTDECTWNGWLKPGQDRATLMKALERTGGTDATEAYALCAKAGESVGEFDVLIHFTDCYLPSWPAHKAKRFVVGVMARSDTPEKIPGNPRIVHVTP